MIQKGNVSRQGSRLVNEKGECEDMAILEEPIQEVRLVKNYIDGEWVESKGEIIDAESGARGCSPKIYTIYL